MPRLTKRLVESLAPADKDYMVWDDEIRGLAVKVTPRGRKAYYLKYRTANGTQRKPSIGVHGKVTTDMARSIARSWSAEVAMGNDPSANRMESRDAPTFAALAERYLSEHAYPHKVATAAKEDARMLRVNLLPRWGSKRVEAVSRRDVSRMHVEIRSQIGHHSANRHLALTGKMLSLAVEWGLRPDNPARGVKMYREEKRDRWLRPDEIRRMFESLAQEPDAIVRGALTFILLTGARKTEALAAKWEDIDFDAALWRIPKTKSQKPQTVPMSTRALSVLQSLPRVEGNPHIFPGKVPGQHLVNLSKRWLRVRERAGLPDARIHDLRRSLGSMMVQAGTSLYVTQRALRHADSRTTADVYAHLGDGPTRAAFEAVGEKVGALMSAANGEAH